MKRVAAFEVLVRALCSLLPKERGGKLAHLRVVPIAGRMTVVLTMTLLFQRGV
jgi:hypothetical protein